MDANLLRTFVTVVRLGSFSDAARQLDYTQSAVSQQIAALEADLGVPVLRRRPVTLTEAGRRLLEHAEPILLRLGAARADVRRLSVAPASTVRLGVSPLADRRFGARALAVAQHSMPRVTFALRVADCSTIATAMAAGELDLGVVDGVTAPSDPLPLPDAGLLATETLAESAVLVALPTGHPLAGRTRLRLADLADAGWVDAPEIATGPARLRTLAGITAGADGFRAGLRYDGTDLDLLVSLIAAGAGLGLLPAHALQGRSGVAGVPLTAPRLAHRTELVHGTLVGAAAEFAQALRLAGCAGSHAVTTLNASI